MAFFRKTKKTGDTTKDLVAKAEAKQNQAKWDELERMVSEQNDAPKPAPSIPTPSTLPESDFTTVTPTTTSLDIDSHDLRETSADAFLSDLKVDMPTDSEFVDVTPEPTQPAPDVSEPKKIISAMAPSIHFETGAREERAGQASFTSDDQDTAPSVDRFTPPPPATNRPDRADIGAMRLDVARISADIQSGEELYRRAQQRIENLTGFVERAEIDFSCSIVWSLKTAA